MRDGRGLLHRVATCPVRAGAAGPPPLLACEAACASRAARRLGPLPTPASVARSLGRCRPHPRARRWWNGSLHQIDRDQTLHTGGWSSAGRARTPGAAAFATPGVCLAPGKDNGPHSRMVYYSRKAVVWIVESASSSSVYAVGSISRNGVARKATVPSGAITYRLRFVAPPRAPTAP